MFQQKIVLGLFCFLTLSAANLQAAEVKAIAGASFSIPDSWKETPPSSTMRAFQFEIPGSGQEKAELAVFYFGEGQGGDIQENIDRWKSQFTKLTSEETQKKTAAGMNITQVLLQGSYQQSGGPMMAAEGAPKENFSMLGAIIEAPKGAVFLKLTGAADVVSGAAPDFNKLIESLNKV